ncbi:MAG: hypothetical protein KDD37_11805, partial [Bdellovibrionales bacterium]|nr:hypothetical protein [Bdellovibrionales bacterium]
MNVLITFGGTKEPIDSVRYIGNSSSGKTGLNIANYLITEGAKVTCIKADGVNDVPEANNINFFTFENLQTALLEELHNNDYDAIIHAAAVSDYRVSKVSSDANEAAAVGGKIRSGQRLQITLEPTPKLIEKIKDVSKNKDILLVGFKLTEAANMQETMDAVYKVFNSGADIVVQNDLSGITKDKHI